MCNSLILPNCFVIFNISISIKAYCSLSPGCGIVGGYNFTKNEDAKNKQIKYLFFKSSFDFIFKLNIEI